MSAAQDAASSADRWFTAQTRRVIAHKLNGDRAACNRGIAPSFGPLVSDERKWGVTLYTREGAVDAEWMSRCPRCEAKPAGEITLEVPFETWK